MPVCCLRTRDEGIQEAGENPARSRHCNRGANPTTPPPLEKYAGGKVGRARSRESGDWPSPVNLSGARTQGEETQMESKTVRQASTQAPAAIPVWGWAAIALLLLALFMLLSASGTLLAPLIGQAAGVTDYLHAFAHDGRHLLAVPCH